jgi:hypothetical protein
MRKQLEDMAAKMKAVNEENAKLKAEQARGVVAEHVKTLGFAPEAAAFYPVNEATTPDAVKAWFDKNGAVFAKAQAETTTAPAEGETESTEEASTEVKSAVPKSVEEIWRHMQANEMAPPDGAQDTMARLANAKTEDEVLEIIGVAPDAVGP